MHFRHLRTKIILLLCSLIVAKAAATTVLLHRSLKESLTESARERGEVIAELMARQLSAPLAGGDWTTAKLLVASEADHSAYVILHSPEGLALVEAGGKGEQLMPRWQAAGSDAPMVVDIPGDTVIDVPARVPDTNFTVHVGISLSAVDSTVQSVLRDVLLVFAASLVVGILAILFIAGFITRPIVRLREATQRISRGEVDVVAPVLGSDELADLATNFNEMAGQIRDRIARSEELRGYYEQILDQLPCGVVVCDDGQQSRYANRAARDVCGNNVKDCDNPSARCGDCLANLLRSTGTGIGRPHTLPDGRVYDVRVAPMTVPANAGSVVMTMLDITEMRALEGRLRRAERLAVAGEVAAGIVHAINNPLDGVRRALDLAGREGADQHRVHDMLALAVEGTDRIATVTRTLLDFARAQDPQASVPVDVNVVAEEAVGLVRLRAEQCGVALRLETAPSLPQLRADPRGLGEVLVNLLVNALDATPAGGSVDVTTRGTADGFVEIVVSDTGEGVPPDLLERIFEPFFTTKAVGQGTGLGLVVARRVVEACGGDISAESHAGKGASFRVRLPSEPARDEQRAGRAAAG